MGIAKFFYNQKMTTTKDLSEFLSENLIEYSKEKLVKKIYELNDKKTLEYCIQQKNHLTYLDSYLTSQNLNAKFFLVEPNYINKDYLVDYSHYYSLCFEDYKKKCTRIHFFTYKNQEKPSIIREIQQIIGTCQNNPDYHSHFFDEYYIGFIVINPIPNTFLGYTLLKHYNSFKKDPNRSFWGVRSYQIHLLGNKIPIQSLAFHEQDSNVGACATLSIWYVIQKAAEDYYINLKSPIEITRDAGIINSDGGRMLPNKGLGIEAICTALTKSNLVTEVRHFSNLNEDNNIHLRRLLYAYSSLGLPIILAVMVPEDERSFVGHAMAICGHRLCNEISILHQSPTEGFISRADYISQLYCHDDQFGPFVSIEFPTEEYNITTFPKVNGQSTSVKVPASNLIDSIWTYCLQENNQEGKQQDKNQGEKAQGCVYSIPFGVIIPTFPKVRISYETIAGMTINFHALILKTLRIQEDSSLNELIWDIRVQYSENFKQEVRNLDIKEISVEGECLFSEKDLLDFKFNILSKSLPKYIWVATLHFEDTKFLSFIFDATGLVNSQLLLHVIFYAHNLKKTIIEAWRCALNVMKDIPQYNQIYYELERALNEKSSQEVFFI